MNDNQKTLLSFVVGAAAGVAAGILLAPYAGKDTRKKLTDTATSLKGQVGTQFEDTLNKFSELADSALAAVSTYSKQAQDIANKVTKKSGNSTSASTTNTGNKGTTL